MIIWKWWKCSCGKSHLTTEEMIKHGETDAKDDCIVRSMNHGN